MFKDVPSALGSSPDLLLDPPATGCSRPTLLPAEPSRTPHPEATGAGGCQDRRSPFPLHAQPLPSPLQKPGAKRSCSSVCDGHHHHPPHLSAPQLNSHHPYGKLRRRSRLVVGHPMKKLLNWLKAVVLGARAKLLRSRCSGVRHQFSFLSLTESSSELLDAASVLDDHVHDDHEDVWDGDDSRTDNDERNLFQLGEGEKDNLVRKKEEEEEEEEAGEGSSHRRSVRIFRTCSRKMSKVTVVSLLWSLLSLLVASACAFSFYHPNWVSHPDHLHSFGLFTHCVRDPRSSSYPRAVCHGYGSGGRVDLSGVPAGAWQASTLLFGGGVCLQCVGALVSLVLLLLPSHPYSGHRVALLCGYAQTLAGE